MVRGELGIEIKEIEINDLLNPYSKYNPDNKNMDFKILNSDNGFLYICGANDWGYLMCDALMPLMKKADNLKKYIQKLISNYKGEINAVVLSKNDYRILDIHHRLLCGGDPIKRFGDFPVVESSKIDEPIKIV